MAALDLVEAGKPVHVRHPHVEQDEIRLLAGDEREHLHARLRLADDLEAAVCLERAADAVEDEPMVVGDDHTHDGQSGRGVRRHPPLARGIALPPTGHRVGPRVGEGSAAPSEGESNGTFPVCLRCRRYAAGPGLRRTVRMTGSHGRRKARLGALLTTLLALVALVLTAVLTSGAAAAQLKAPKVEVVGSGMLHWKQVVVRARPTPDSPRVAVLRQFRADFRPTYVLALRERVDDDGLPTWYRVSVPGRPNG